MASFASNVAVRLSMFFRLNDQVAQIDRLFFGNSTAFDSAWDSDDFFSLLNSNGTIPQFKASMTSAAEYLGAKLYYKPASAPPILAQSTAHAGACTGSADPAPSQIAGLIQWKSDIGGPRGRGRMYVPFAAAASIGTGGLLAAGYVTELTAIGTGMIDGYNVPNDGGGGGNVLVVPCTRYIQPVPSNLPAVMNNFTVASGFGTQRRRGFFGKPNNNPF
jgi:hypothetical protein